jgi:hypothetical protein
VHKLIAAALQLQRYAAAPAEPCYELHTGCGGAKMPTRHRMVHFCWTFGALALFERQGYQYRGEQGDGAHGFRAPATARPRVAPDKFLRSESKLSQISHEVSTIFFNNFFSMWSVSEETCTRRKLFTFSSRHYTSIAIRQLASTFPVF